MKEQHVLTVLSVPVLLVLGSVIGLSAIQNHTALAWDGGWGNGWSKVLWIVFALYLVIIAADNFYWIRDGSWFTTPIGSAVAIFKWVAIAIICYVLVRPSSLEVPTTPAYTVAADAKEKT